MIGFEWRAPVKWIIGTSNKLPQSLRVISRNYIYLIWGNPTRCTLCGRQDFTIPLFSPTPVWKWGNFQFTTHSGPSGLAEWWPLAPLHCNHWRFCREKVVAWICGLLSLCESSPQANHQFKITKEQRVPHSAITRIAGGIASEGLTTPHPISGERQRSEVRSSKNVLSPGLPMQNRRTLYKLRILHNIICFNALIYTN